MSNPEYGSRLEALNNIASVFGSYPASFPGMDKIVLSSIVISDNAELAAGDSNENVDYVVTGRIRAIRNSGMFMDIYDTAGKMQIYSKEFLAENHQLVLKNLHIGDIIAVRGFARRTKRGELSIASREIYLLTKALHPLPDGWDGLNNQEVCYRSRWLDMITNNETRERLRSRSRIIRSIRNYLEDNNYMEVETPMLHPIAGGASARPFKTHHNALEQDFYMRIAPELYLKKLVVGGFDRVFELNRCFRNEGISTRHNPEFTSVEIYGAYQDYRDMMDLTQNIIHVLVHNLGQEDAKVSYGDKVINYNNMRRNPMHKLVQQYTGLNVLEMTKEQIGEKLGEVPVTWGHGVEALFAEHVEKNLIDPTFVTHLPSDISPLAKRCADDNRLTERFELYINGWEIANGFSELNDSRLQAEIFREQMAQKASGDSEAMEYDQSFIDALEIGLPPTGGLGIGIDRLVMLMTNARSIRDVIAFPTLRS